MLETIVKYLLCVSLDPFKVSEEEKKRIIEFSFLANTWIDIGVKKTAIFPECYSIANAS